MWYLIGFILGALGAGLLPKIFDNLTRKQIAILGPKQTGKTVLQVYLRTGLLDTKYIPTFKAKLSKGTIKLDDLELKLKEGVDVSGNDEFVSVWKELYQTADYKLYLFNSSLILQNHKEYISLVDKHLRMIGEWNKNISASKFVIIGTFADKIDLFDSNDIKILHKISEDIQHKMTSSINASGVTADNILIGSLRDMENTNILVGKLLARLVEA